MSTPDNDFLSGDEIYSSLGGDLHGLADAGPVTLFETPASSSERGESPSTDNAHALSIDTDALSGPSENTLAPSNSLDFRIERPFASGALSDLYVAIDSRLHRRVILKRLKPSLAGSARNRKRFQREAQITGQLEHPNIVSIYEMPIVSEDELPFYVMRWIRGKTLRDVCREFHRKRAEQQSSPLELIRLLQAFVDICQAIGYAHSRGVIHRDLKPENIEIGDFGEVAVLDWGLAKLLRESNAPSDEMESHAIDVDWRDGETMFGSILGTPTYMAPEQADPNLGPVDERTDVFGLGASLFFILTGETPRIWTNHKEATERAATQPIDSPRRLNSSIPRALEAVCMKATAFEPSERYPSATSLAEDVQRFLADRPVSVFSEPWRSRALRWVGKHKLLCTSLVGLMIAAAFAAALGVMLWWQSYLVLDQDHILAEQYAANLMSRRGIMLCEEGQIQEGLFWLERSRRLIADHDPEMAEEIKISIAFWSEPARNSSK
jgi:serine/threonine protein kinase